MQPLGGQDMGFNALEERRQRRGAGAHLVGEGGQAQRHAFSGVALGLAVERLMLSELLEQDHGEKAGTDPASRGRVEGRRRLADLLAIPARELLAHILDHLPLARDHFQGLGDDLSELAQPIAATAITSRRRWHDHTLPRQMLGERLACRALALVGGDLCCLGGSPLGGDLVLGGRAF